ncbi:Pentatricopeptide repeat-containing protein At1g63130, mitochondrial [Sugiyamaella lignohabitans]|uniref:Pentatricopeptide repeat-containing protein At1g63130, mitochondrial n=1 Tax=Sugiyamaella lignohabitans TaxID=796027 RepID=A0A167EZR7_9ASCO|nr:Pentatricopeptide repeat-containing protein At1g63130, mitochondrial [Sugiyamaella lignohabitans]ANB14645.1 Pentatricopeptide repeat-containing protein At1g63130, mitochondrial [Sugiyamaella lignohabitans]
MRALSRLAAGSLRPRLRNISQQNAGALLVCNSIGLELLEHRLLVPSHGPTPTIIKRNYNPFKKQPKWESDTKKSKNTEECDQLARKLRESLASQADSKQVKKIIFDLVNVSQHRVSGEYIPLIERALQKFHFLSKKSKLLSIDEVQTLYRSVVQLDATAGSNMDADKDKVDPARGWLLQSSVSQSSSESTLITKLYSVLYNSQSQLPTTDRVQNGLLYMKYLRSENLIVESRKLLTALIQDATILASLDEPTILQFTSIIQNINPDVDSLIALYEILGSTGSLSLTLFHEGILAFTEIASKHPENESTQQLMKFLNSTIFIDSKLEPTRETIIIALDCCLTLSSAECGKRLLRTLVKPRLDDLLADDSDPESSLQFYELLLMSCSKFGEDVATGKKIVDRILTSFTPDQMAKETWDVLAQWTVYYSPDTDVLETLIDQMVEHGFNPDEVTLSDVVSIAIGAAKRTDKYIDSVVNMFNLKFDVDSNVQTFAFLIDRKLHSCDLEAAQKLFQNSITASGCDWGVDSQRHIPTLDRLLVALCTSPPVDQRNVFEVYQQVLMFTRTVGYNAQCELLKMFLSIGNSYDVELFIKEQFGDRPGLPWQAYSEIYHVMFDYIMTCKDYKLAWDIYGLLNGLIKLPYESYYTAMELFCRLGRPDAALLILKYLRVRSRKEAIPSPDRNMYILLFNEFGKTLYEEGVQELQGLLRTDLYTESDIEIMNSILGAYCNLQDPHRTKNTWLEINGFPEGQGVNNDTITIMIKHLTRYSLPEVEKLWVSFPETYNLTPDADNLRQYVIANCYHGYYMRALEVTKHMEQTYGIVPGRDIIEALYNWTMLDSRKKLVEKWAIETHPDTWKQLQESNSLKTYVLPDNVDNDSEDNLRAQTIQTMEADDHKNSTLITR